ncbi:MAG: hypothetical protein BGO66_17000 [Alicycliphilus sp. 69-12]|nr:MAG: hypothetical protein BGO66_17000 [Alicycliphilus sp. 69-12]
MALLLLIVALNSTSGACRAYSLFLSFVRWVNCQFEQVIDSVLNLERVEDFGAVMRLMVRTSS